MAARPSNDTLSASEIIELITSGAKVVLDVVGEVTGASQNADGSVTIETADGNQYDLDSAGRYPLAGGLSLTTIIIGAVVLLLLVRR